MISQRLLLLVILLGLFALSFCHVNHRCIHDKKFRNYKRPEIRLSRAEKRHRQYTPTLERNIKIAVSYNQLDLPPRTYNLIKSLMDLSVQFLSKRLKVKSYGQRIRLPETPCYEAEIPAEHVLRGFDGDTVIYVTSSNQPLEGFIAWATSCLQDPLNGRPVAGQINWNVAKLEYTPDKFESIVDVAIHEIAHVLGFDSSLFDSYVDGFGSTRPRGAHNILRQGSTVRGRRKNFIVSPKVMQVARDYYQCKAIDGVEIEDEGGQGSAGSHWERTTLHNEIMGASTLPDESFSIFTLALLEDSGWYKPVYDLAEPLFFGKGAGCNFLKGRCSPQVLPKRREWCSDTTVDLCTYTFKASAFCGKDGYSDGCQYARAYSNTACENPKNTPRRDYRGETYDTGSRCVVGNIVKDGFVDNGEIRGLCYQFKCDAQHSKITFMLKGGVQLECLREGDRVEATSPYKGTITCPEPKTYCDLMYPSCPNACSTKGYCNNGVCECISGYGGNDCSVLGGPAPTRTSVVSVTADDGCSNVVCPRNRKCSGGQCVCAPGHSGKDCTKNCPKNCSGNGSCSVDGVCVCHPNYLGEDCSITSSSTSSLSPNNACHQNCNNRGVCYFGKCQCYSGFTGSSYENSLSGFTGSCQKNCFQDLLRGHCAQAFNEYGVQYFCECNAGFKKPDCSAGPQPTPGCRVNCGNKGRCVGGKCVCDPFYIGEDCSQPACVNFCNKKGTCVRVQNSSEYTCRCFDGTQGAFCH